MIVAVAVLLARDVPSISSCAAVHGRLLVTCGFLRRTVAGVEAGLPRVLSSVATLPLPSTARAAAIRLSRTVRATRTAAQAGISCAASGRGFRPRRRLVGGCFLHRRTVARVEARLPRVLGSVPTAAMPGTALAAAVGRARIVLAAHTTGRAGASGKVHRQHRQGRLRASIRRCGATCAANRTKRQQGASRHAERAEGHPRQRELERGGAARARVTSSAPRRSPPRRERPRFGN